jgi:hypothetical protein
LPLSETLEKRAPENLTGGQHGLAIVERLVEYQPRAKATASRPRRHECIRMRLVYERQVVMGRYLSVQGHREPGSVGVRTLRSHWDATVCEDAIRYARRRVAQRLRPGRRMGLKTHAVLAVAEGLRAYGAPVNHHVASEVLKVLGLSCSKEWFARTLRANGWRPLGRDEYPRDAPGHCVTNWLPGPP